MTARPTPRPQISPREVPASPQLQRVEGRARVTFCRHGDHTRLDRLEQGGSARVRLPKTHTEVPVAVLLNTAGGLTGGDRLTYDAAVGDGAHAIVTTQAAERIYRRLSGTARVDNRVSVGAGALLEWLPQETILFDRAGLARSFSADLAPEGRMLAVESLLLGRAAMGESVRQLTFRDRWRIRRDGRLFFAEDSRIEGDATDIMSGPATAAGGRAFATLIDCRPDAEAQLRAARDLALSLEDGDLGIGASALPGVLILRFIAMTGQALREGLIRFLESWRAAPLPRTWHC